MDGGRLVGKVEVADGCPHYSERVRTLVLGAAGMLAHDLLPVLIAAGHHVTGADLNELDITDPRACLEAAAGHDVVVNAAAWTAVDDAEHAEAAAFAVNAVGAANAARGAAAAGARFVQLSTDYVFAGELAAGAAQPYQEDAPAMPRSAYGRTKAAGEWAARALCPATYVVRTAWLYGAGGPNFVTTMARLAAERDTVSVVDDQVGQPTWTRDLSHGIAALLAVDAPYGVYHATSRGSTSWFGFARAIFAGLGLDPERVEPTTTEAFPRPAPRPAYSVLGHDAWTAAGLAELPEWQVSLDAALPSLVRPAEAG